MSDVSRPIAVVFGASGFLARYIVARLARQGYHVRAASRHPSNARHLLPMGAVGQIERIYAPIQEADKVAAAVEGAEIVVNTVGILAQFGRQQTFDKTMHLGAENVANACAKAGVQRLIHISAIGADINSPSQYGRAKAAGEAGVLTAFPTATILRPSIMFGVEDDFFNRFAAMPFVPLIGGGDTLFQPVYVEDVAKAAESAWRTPDTQGQTYELGGPQVMSFRECLEIMLDIIGQARPMIHIPWGIAEIIGAFGNILPTIAPITGDQVKSLGLDNIVTDGAKGLRDLGVTPTDARAILPTYLDRYISGGKLGAFNEG